MQFPHLPAFVKYFRENNIINLDAKQELVIDNMENCWGDLLPPIHGDRSEKPTALDILTRIAHLFGKTVRLRYAQLPCSFSSSCGGKIFSYQATEKVSIIAEDGPVFVKFSHLSRLMVRVGIDAITFPENHSVHFMGYNPEQEGPFENFMSRKVVKGVGASLRGTFTTGIYTYKDIFRTPVMTVSNENGTTLSIHDTFTYPSIEAFTKRLQLGKLTIPAGRTVTISDPSIPTVYGPLLQIGAFSKFLSGFFLLDHLTVDVDTSRDGLFRINLEREISFTPTHLTTIELKEAKILYTTGRELIHQMVMRHEELTSFYLPVLFMGERGTEFADHDDLIECHLRKYAPCGLEVFTNGRYTTQSGTTDDGIPLIRKTEGDLHIALRPKPLLNLVDDLLADSYPEFKQELYDYDHIACTRIVQLLIWHYLTGYTKKWQFFPPDFFHELAPKTIQEIITILTEKDHPFNSALATEGTYEKCHDILFKIPLAEFDALKRDELPPPVKTALDRVQNIAYPELKGHALKHILKKLRK